MQTIDCRDMPVPKPVVLAQNTLEEIQDDDAVTFIVNCDISEDNILTFAQNKGYFVRKETKRAGVFITISKNFACDITQRHSEDNTLYNKTFLITSDCIGKGLYGDALMQEFLDSLLLQKKLPNKIIFLNQGARLTCLNKDSTMHKTLFKLQNRGIEILVNLNSLEDLELQKEHKIGKSISMSELSELMINTTTSTL